MFVFQGVGPKYASLLVNAFENVETIFQRYACRIITPARLLTINSMINYMLLLRVHECIKPNSVGTGEPIIDASSVAFGKLAESLLMKPNSLKLKTVKN